jgi:serine protease Do
MIERTDATRDLRRVFSLRRSVVLAAVFGICIDGAGVLVGPHDVTQSRLLGWPTSLARAQTSKPSNRLSDFADIVDRVRPAVIGIRAQVEDEETTGQRPRPPGSQGSPFERFFGAPQERPDVPRRPQRTATQGSGFFISADGYIVTSNHVVERAKSIEITTGDNKIYPAKLVGADSRSDLALLKVEGDRTFTFVRLADGTPRIGEWVLAIGNPFGLGGTVTAGIVSARARDIKIGTFNDFIQVDAPVNQGNSGGPTFNLDGDVIGVISAIFSPTGGSIGIGFAIPADTVRPVVAQLRDKGAVTRGWIGIKIQTVTDEIAQGFGIKRAQGALVVEAQPNSPAAKAGLSSGDIITSLNGEPIKDDRELMKKIGDLAPDTSVKLGVFRKGEEITIALTLGELPLPTTRRP